MKIIEKNYQKVDDGAYMNSLAGFTDSVFQDFENYLRTQVGFIEANFRLVLKDYN